jgi:hypothetical protein
MLVSVRRSVHDATESRLPARVPRVDKSARVSPQIAELSQCRHCSYLANAPRLQSSLASNGSLLNSVVDEHGIPGIGVDRTASEATTTTQLQKVPNLVSGLTTTADRELLANVDGGSCQGS